MRVVLKEMQKMLNLKSVLLLLVFTLLFFAFFLEIPKKVIGKYYSTGNYGHDYTIDLYRELISLVGTSLSPDEVKYLDEIEQEQQKVLDEFYEKHEDFDVWQYSFTYSDLKPIVGDRDEITRIITASHYLDAIHYLKNQGLWFDWDEEELEFNMQHSEVWPDWYYERVLKLYTSDEYPLLYGLRSSFSDLTFISFWISVCCMLLVLPYQVREKLSKVKSLGASAKIGRSLYFRQWLATIISCVLVTLGNLVLWAVFFCMAGYTDFLACSNINSSHLYWLETSFGIHLFIYILLIILFAIIVGTVFFLLSEVSSYIEALAMGIPCWVLFCVIASYVFVDLFAVFGDGRPDIKFFEVWLLGIIALFAMSVLGFFVRRNKVMEIFD